MNKITYSIILVLGISLDIKAATKGGTVNLPPCETPIPRPRPLPAPQPNPAPRPDPVSPLPAPPTDCSCAGLTAAQNKQCIPTRPDSYICVGKRIARSTHVCIKEGAACILKDYQASDQVPCTLEGNSCRAQTPTWPVWDTISCTEDRCVRTDGTIELRGCLENKEPRGTWPGDFSDSKNCQQLTVPGEPGQDGLTVDTSSCGSGCDSTCSITKYSKTDCLIPIVNMNKCSPIITPGPGGGGAF